MPGRAVLFLRGWASLLSTLYPALTSTWGQTAEANPQLAGSLLPRERWVSDLHSKPLLPLKSQYLHALHHAAAMRLWTSKWPGGLPWTPRAPQVPFGSN